MFEAWREISINQINVGDTLRVKKDAYKTDAGYLHNGRMVQVTRIDSGDVYVKTVDNKIPEVTEARHPPYKLEIRKPEFDKLQ